MHMYAGDLEDVRSLVTSRMKGAHVHIGVGTQTGLGTGIPGTSSRNIGTATTPSWDTCRQPQTLSGNANIFTCNYNGRHEPQQIDHIL